MGIPDLLSVCISAFMVVFIILTILALFMRIMIVLFPDKSSDDDQAVYAAIACIFKRIYPGTQIKKIEEVK